MESGPKIIAEAVCRGLTPLALGTDGPGLAWPAVQARLSRLALEALRALAAVMTLKHSRQVQSGHSDSTAV